MLIEHYETGMNLYIKCQDRIKNSIFVRASCDGRKILGVFRAGVGFCYVIQNPLGQLTTFRSDV